MPREFIQNLMLTAIVLATTVMLLGTTFLVILRAPKKKLGLCISVLLATFVAGMIGAWTAVRPPRPPTPDTDRAAPVLDSPSTTPHEVESNPGESESRAGDKRPGTESTPE